MGLLSSILTVGGAAVGSAFGMPQVGAALGGAVGGAIEKSKSSKSASKEIAASEERARADKAAAAAKVGAIQAPYVQGGYQGWNALSGRLGLPPQGGAPAAPAPTGQPMASAPGYTPPAGGFPIPTADERRAASGTGGGIDPTQMDDFGPTRLNALKTGSAGTSPLAPNSNAPGMIDMEQQPDGSWAAPTAGAPGNALAPPAGGTYGDTANPTAPAPYQAPDAPATYTAPGEFEYGVDDYTASPGYQYRQDQARKGILASASATGALKSGSALKALYDRGDQIAYQDFGAERDFAAGRYDKDRSFGYGASRDARSDFQDDRDFGYGQSRDARGDYETDRGYLTGRYDRTTDDLFKYTDMGRQAAGVVGNAELGVGTDAAASQRAVGEARAGNALQQGDIWSGLAADVGSTVAGAFKPKNALASPASNPFAF